MFRLFRWILIFVLLLLLTKFWLLNSFGFFRLLNRLRFDLLKLLLFQLSLILLTTLLTLTLVPLLLLLVLLYLHLL